MSENDKNTKQKIEQVGNGLSEEMREKVLAAAERFDRANLQGDVKNVCDMFLTSFFESACGCATGPGNPRCDLHVARQTFKLIEEIVIGCMMPSIKAANKEDLPSLLLARGVVMGLEMGDQLLQRYSLDTVQEQTAKARMRLGGQESHSQDDVDDPEFHSLLQHFQNKGKINVH